MEVILARLPLQGELLQLTYGHLLLVSHSLLLILAQWTGDVPVMVELLPLHLWVKITSVRLQYIDDDPFQFDSTFFFRECLWDGEGCADTSTCCSRIDHPYFIKELASSTSDDIDLSVCNTDLSMEEDFAIELIELYV